MAFDNSGGVINIEKVGGGELWKDEFSITTDKFDPAIKTRKFASYNAGILETGVTGTLAGVVVRNITGSLEVDEPDDVHERTTTVRFIRSGVVSVDVEESDIPAFGGKVYTRADGRATTDPADTLTNGEFIREIQTNVWLIRLI